MPGALSSDLSLAETKDHYEYPRIYRRILHWSKQQLSAGSHTQMGRADCESPSELYWLCQSLHSGMRRPPDTLSRSLCSGLLFQMLPRNRRLVEAANWLDKTVLLRRRLSAFPYSMREIR
jgi:hypothetical protein